MAAELTIPPALLRDIEEGAFAQLVRPAEEMLSGALVHALPDRETRAHLQDALALLDLLHRNPVQPVPASPLLLASIEVAEGYLKHWLGERQAADPRRAERADELCLLRELRAQVRRAVAA
jgi:hypothetical protein